MLLLVRWFEEKGRQTIVKGVDHYDFTCFDVVSMDKHTLLFTDVAPCCISPIDSLGYKKSTLPSSPHKRAVIHVERLILHVFVQN